LVLGYKGLILNFTDSAFTYYDSQVDDYVAYPSNTPVLIGGRNASGSITGTQGSITYTKSLVCNPRRDVDVNGDGKVNFADSDIIRNNYNQAIGDANFSEYYDINCDDKLNVKEIARIGFEYQTRTLS